MFHWQLRQYYKTNLLRFIQFNSFSFIQLNENRKWIRIYWKICFICSIQQWHKVPPQNKSKWQHFTLSKKKINPRELHVLSRCVIPYVFISETMSSNNWMGVMNKMLRGISDVATSSLWEMNKCFDLEDRFFDENFKKYFLQASNNWYRFSFS